MVEELEDVVEDGLGIGEDVGVGGSKEEGFNIERGVVGEATRVVGVLAVA